MEKRPPENSFSTTQPFRKLHPFDWNSRFAILLLVNPWPFFFNCPSFGLLRSSRCWWWWWVMSIRVAPNRPSYFLGSKDSLPHCGSLWLSFIYDGLEESPICVGKIKKGFWDLHMSIAHISLRVMNLQCGAILSCVCWFRIYSWMYTISPNNY